MTDQSEAATHPHRSDGNREAVVTNRQGMVGFAFGVLGLLGSWFLLLNSLSLTGSIRIVWLFSLFAASLGAILSRRGVRQSKLHGAPYRQLAKAGFVMSLIALLTPVLGLIAFISLLVFVDSLGGQGL